MLDPPASGPRSSIDQILLGDGRLPGFGSLQGVDAGPDITGLPKRGGVTEKTIDALLFQPSQALRFGAGCRDLAVALFLLKLGSGFDEHS